MRLHNVPTCNQKLKVALWSAAICTFILTIAAPASALQCGDTITTDTKLTADLGPCPGDGLNIEDRGTAEVGPLTLDLNGHTTKGLGAGTGLRIYMWYHPLTVKGPGTIENFDIGVDLSNVGRNVMVRGLNLRANRFGLAVAFSMSGLRVLRNTIDGADLANSTGIGIGYASDGYFYRNVVIRNSKGVVVSGGWSQINENLIAFNGTGFSSSYFDSNCFALHGNRITRNEGNGIDLVDDPTHEFAQMQVITAGGQCHVIEDNEVGHNEGSGIVVAGQQFLLQDNVVQHNRLNGISISDSGMSSLPTTQVAGARTSPARALLRLYPSASSVSAA